MSERTRSCLVCLEPTTSEGQLCSACVDVGCRVTDDAVIVPIEIDLSGLPESWRP